MRFMITAAAAAGLAFSGAPLRAQSPTFPTNAALDALVAKQMAEAGIMGLAAAVIVNRQVVWMKGYGFADWQRTRPFTPATIMNVGSIAKPFTGVAMMRAVQEGKLSLDEDINRYLPFRVVNPHHPTEKITLRHLATHTSGITDRWEVYSRAYHYGGDSPEPLGAVPRAVLRARRQELLARQLHRRQAGRASRVLQHRGRPGRVHRRARRRRAAERLHAQARLHAAADDGHRVVPVRGGPRESLHAVRLAERLTDSHPALRPHDLSGWRRPHLGRGSLEVLHRPAERRRVSGRAHPGRPDGRGDAALPVHRRQSAGELPGRGRQLRALLADEVQRNAGRARRQRSGASRRTCSPIPPGEVGVVLLVNTSTSTEGPGQKAYSDVFNALWKYAESLRAEKK